MQTIPKLKTAIFDIESDGLLDTITTCHILCIEEYETGKRFTYYGDEEVRNVGIKVLKNADMVVGHNILDYDLRALYKLYPEFEIDGKVRDTLVMTRVMFSHQKELDFRLHERGKLPSEFIGRHSLDSWGYRIGKYKGEYSKEREREAKKLGITDGYDDEEAAEIIREFVWATPTPEMYEYCENDVDVTSALWSMLLEQDYPNAPIVFEHEIAEALIKQQENGFPFNTEKAIALRDDLYKFKEEIKIECLELFNSKFVPNKKVTFGKMREVYNSMDWEKIDNEEMEIMIFDFLSNQPTDKPLAEFNIPKKTLRYKDRLRGDRIAGCPYTPIYLKEFNPGSRQQVADRLIEMGWKPEEFTPKGFPKVNEITLKHAAEHVPIAESLSSYFGVTKTLGQLSDGDNGWLKLVTPENKIHHYVNPCGAVTGRCTHASPNLGQVPAISKDKNKNIKMGREGGWGYECRSLFHTVSPFVMMGSDLSGIELRCLAHYMAEFDDGEYGRVILDGDIHTVNMNAAGLESREQAKTFIYACCGCEVQILTTSGYKTYDQLTLGELVYSLNTKDMKPEYVPIEKIVSYEEADLWLVKTIKGDVRVTPNHRWFMFDGSYKTTEELTDKDFIVMSHFEAIRVLETVDLKVKEKVWCVGTRNSNFYIKSPDGYKGLTGNTLYGAGPAKIGSIVLPFGAEHEQERIGKELLDRFLRNIPALKKLMKKLKQESRKGWITGLDGRRLFIRAQHAALNTLLQNAGAMIAKKWYLLFDDFMYEKGYNHSWEQDYAMMAFIHDEIQVAVKEEIAQIAEETSKEAAIAAGKYFDFKLPVKADTKIGLNWAETH